MPNVLVFESDSTFAGELRGELEQRGCKVTVVDDASVGLQTAAGSKPDLILLTIELPKMNGFSVCNKLKRDPALKEVPLIIMSSDSTEETFEQHRRLRTHAEDYVHKPIAFSDLASRITKFITLSEGPAGGAGAEDLVIDEDIEIEETETGSDAAAAAGAEAASPVDAEVDAFTESAFGAMVDESGAAKAAASEPPVSAEAVDLEAQSRPPSAPSPAAEAHKPASIPPRPSQFPLDTAAREELTRTIARVREVEKELRETRSKLEDAEEEARRGAASAAEAQRLQKELDEARAKAASGGKGGSAREFLDLREALNKKDKEILDLKDQLTHKEKDVLSLKDTNLSLEREKADLTDRIADAERQVVEYGRQLDSARADKDQSAKRADDFKRKGEKLAAELEARTNDLADTKRKHEETLAIRDASEASLRAEHQEALEKAAADLVAAVAEAEKRSAEATRAAADDEKAREIAGLLEKASKDQAQAVSEREAALKKEHDSRLAALHRANEDAMGRLKAEHAQSLEDAASGAAATLSAMQESLTKDHEAKLSAVKSELASVTEAKTQGEASRDARIATLTADLDTATGDLDRTRSSLAEKEASLAAAEANLAATRQELAEARSELSAFRSKAEKATAKWAEDKAALDRVKDALAAALAQIDEVEGRTLD